MHFWKSVMSRRQNDGSWFVNVCNVDYANSYVFKLYSNNLTKVCNRLSLGAQGM